MNEMNKPREKLVRMGRDELSKEELMAILLNTGTKKQNVFSLARTVTEKFSDRELLEISVEELTKINGIGVAKATTIIAALQLGKIITKNVLDSTILKITSPRDVYEILKDEMQLLNKEHLIALLLNKKNDIISKELITVGIIDRSIAHPREIFRPCIKKSASSLILVHNHPSGDPKASDDDILLTKRIAKAGEILGIELLDHIIIGKNSFVSIKQEHDF